MKYLYDNYDLQVIVECIKVIFYENMFKKNKLLSKDGAGKQKLCLLSFLIIYIKVRTDFSLDGKPSFYKDNREQLYAIHLVQIIYVNKS
jgi:hypothetical protein